MKAVWYRGMKMLGLGVALSVVATTASAQQEGPAPSPAAMVQQVVGENPVTITYSSPGVKNRVIWGELVPHDEVWRAGANAKTTIEFGEDVNINGEALAAGKYGLQIMPTASSWELIFSDNPAGSSMQRDEANDVLTVSITPSDAPFRERLAYSFDNMTDDSATVALHWEKKRGEFKITLGSGSDAPSFSGAAGDVFEIVNSVAAKLGAQDIDGTMEYYSDDFASDQGGGKAEYTEFLAGAKDQGFLEDMEFLMEDLEIEVDGDKATVANMEIEGAFGVLTLEFELEKRDGGWIITYQAQY